MVDPVRRKKDDVKDNGDRCRTHIPCLLSLITVSFTAERASLALEWITVQTFEQLPWTQWSGLSNEVSGIDQEV